MAIMYANSSVADRHHPLPVRADQLQRAAETLRNEAGSVQAVPNLPVTLAHVQETLDLLGVGIQRMAHAVADWCGESIGEDSAPPEARALLWHLGATAEALRASRQACSASGKWSRRLLAEQLEADEDAGWQAAPDGLARLVPLHAPDVERPRHGRPVTGLTLGTVVVGYDGSPPSERALERATTLLTAGGTVVLVTASPSLDPPGVVSEPILDAPASDERSALLRRGRALLRQHGTEATLVATDSDPAEALIRAARDAGADMILVGQTGSGYVTRALLGSTAENVLRHAPCDVLVVT